MGCYICITDVQKSIDKISGQAEQGQYIIYISKQVKNMRRNTKTMYEWRKAYREKDE